MKKYKLKIEGLDCPNCARELEEELQEIADIENVSINFLTQKLNFDCNEENYDELIKKVKKTITKSEPDVTIEEQYDKKNEEKSSKYNNIIYIPLSCLHHQRKNTNNKCNTIYNIIPNSRTSSFT